MKQAWVVVTGAGSGLGRAMAVHFSQNGFPVLGIGRRLAPLQEIESGSISILSADVSEQEGRQAIYDAIPTGDHIKYLIHNAGVLEPIQPLMDVKPADFRKHMSINLEAPLFCTQMLAPKFQANSTRVLHVSSGAAVSPYEGWGTYCTSKAALNMVYRVLDLELKAKGIRVGSVRPGVVDTPMQSVVRSADEAVFPNLQRFVDLKESNQLLPPEKVARFMFWLLTETTPDEFAAEEWDIRDDRHQGKWE
uniref:Short-chain dehydrogenase n=1 Tax=Craspedostauros australis TaxID=1486917 RepID=A0A7R9WVQ2_9STRA|mmetsp:Transcript_23017/g.64138  ORF Transcript_23017/g.64138 Transcript_23017/m.64138 type:complete len:249 (+) Transcript_23017:157-903(+)